MTIMTTLKMIQILGFGIFEFSKLWTLLFHRCITSSYGIESKKHWTKSCRFWNNFPTMYQTPQLKVIWWFWLMFLLRIELLIWFLTTQLWFKCPNWECDPTLNILSSRSFQQFSTIINLDKDKVWSLKPCYKIMGWYSKFSCVKMHMGVLGIPYCTPTHFPLPRGTCLGASKWGFFFVIENHMSKNIRCHVRYL
jgi:hypothetical protein